MVSYDEIQQKVQDETYLVNLTKLEEIVNNSSDVSKLEKNEQLEMFYYAIIISKKYDKSYDQVLTLFDKYLSINNLFEVVYHKFYFFKTVIEKKNFINELKIFDIDLAYGLLQKIISEAKVKNIVEFKKMFCKICIDMSSLSKYNVYQKSDYIQSALKLSKEMNEKNLYKTLIKIDKQLKTEIIQSMGEMTFDFPMEVNKSFTIIENKIRNAFSEVTTVEGFIKLFVNKFCIKVEDMIFFHSSSEGIKSSKDVVRRNKSIVDLISWNTYDGMKLVKARKIDEMVDDYLRKIMIKIVVNPMIEEGVRKLGKHEIIEYLCHSYFVFEEDRIDIEFALNAFFDRDYRTFIYYIIPNIEKILRNILEKNDIPSYHNSLSNPQYQTTFVLTDSLKKLEEENILDKELLKLLNDKLNNPELENYRNRLAHKLDNNLFCYDCASDLLRILIVVLFCYEKNDEYLTIFGERKEIEDILLNLEEKMTKVE